MFRRFLDTYIYNAELCRTSETKGFKIYFKPIFFPAKAGIKLKP